MYNLLALEYFCLNKNDKIHVRKHHIKSATKATSSTFVIENKQKKKKKEFLLKAIYIPGWMSDEKWRTQLLSEEHSRQRATFILPFVFTKSGSDN